jgi:hypothetical protein
VAPTKAATTVDEASAEQPTDPKPAAGEGKGAAEEPDPSHEPPTELAAFLALRFPQHEDFRTFEVWTPNSATNPDEIKIVLAYSTGAQPDTGHIAGIYEVAEDRIATRADLTFDRAEALDFTLIDQLVQSEDGRVLGSPWGADIWFLREGAIGGHGSYVNLLRWSPNNAGPSAFTIELSWSSSLPTAALKLVDYDADGVPELRLDDTDPYVFCYACGVRKVGFQVARWNGSNLVMAPLARLAASALGPAKSAVDFAIELSEANLWIDAINAIDLAARLVPNDPTIEWNAILIRAQAAEREAAAGAVYPLLTHIYAGQFGQAVASLRGILPFDLLDLHGPVTAGTPAEGWESVVAETLIRSSDDALTLRSDVAPAFFLRGLARFWIAPDQAEAAITDINTAAAIDPSEPLYEAVANLLTP